MEKQLASLIENEQYLITLLANSSAYLNQQLEDINWVGFYLLQDNHLILGPFQGKVACEIIEIGKGVCGTCALKKETIVVDDVHQFAGHIACDSASNSEIVIPLFVKNQFYGLLDIDSPKFSRFAKEKEKLELCCKILEKKIEELI